MSKLKSFIDSSLAVELMFYAFLLISSISFGLIAYLNNEGDPHAAAKGIGVGYMSMVAISALVLWALKQERK